MVSQRGCCGERLTLPPPLALSAVADLSSASTEVPSVSLEEALEVDAFEQGRMVS